MATDLQKALLDAESKVDQLKRQIAQGTCQETGHDWQFLGGCNAGCAENCECSIPVYHCPKCKDCDYGDNEEASEIKAECLRRRKEDGCVL